MYCTWIPTSTYNIPFTQKSRAWPNKAIGRCLASDVLNRVVLTRESKKNLAMKRLLLLRDVPFFEFPCIKHVAGPDAAKLSPALHEPWSWIILTSPEAAKTFVEHWRQSPTHPDTKFAVVGTSTARALLDFSKRQLSPDYCAPQANGATLADKLPFQGNSSPPRVLYPSSARASQTIERTLRRRGFRVTRILAYDTVAVPYDVKGCDRTAVRDAWISAVISFASPSAVKAWCDIMRAYETAEHISGDVFLKRPVVALGETTREAALQAGMRNVSVAEQLTLEGWCSSIQKALGVSTDLSH
eukprot:Rmarinus@m.1877